MRIAIGPRTSGGVDGAVKVGNATLTCRTGGVSVGESVTVASRPEDIDAEGGPGDGENVVEVEIAEMEFLGSVYRASLGGPALGVDGFRADWIMRG